MGCDGQQSEILGLFCLTKDRKKAADAFKHVESIAYHAPIGVCVYGNIISTRTTILYLYLFSSEVDRCEHRDTDHANCKDVTILEVSKLANPGYWAIDDEEDNTEDPKWPLLFLRVPFS